MVVVYFDYNMIMELLDCTMAVATSFSFWDESVSRPCALSSKVDSHLRRFDPFLGSNVNAKFEFDTTRVQAVSARFIEKNL